MRCLGASAAPCPCGLLKAARCGWEQAPASVPTTQIPLVPPRRAQSPQHHGLELLGKLPRKSLSSRFAKPFSHVFWDPNLPCWRSTCHPGAWGRRNSFSARRHILPPGLELLEMFRAASSSSPSSILHSHPPSPSSSLFSTLLLIPILHLHPPSPCLTPSTGTSPARQVSSFLPSHAESYPGCGGPGRQYCQPGGGWDRQDRHTALCP